MGKPKGKYTQYTGLDEVDGMREAEAEVRAYFDMVAKELEEGLQ